MDRAAYYHAHHQHRCHRRNVAKFSLLPHQAEKAAGYLPFLPQPPRSAVGQLLLDQAERRRNRLYWIGYRKRQAARDALPVAPSRIPQIAGWDRTAVAA